MSAMTGGRVQVEIPDALYYRRTLKCQSACPVGTVAGRYVCTIADGDFSHAYRIAAGPNPFVAVCSRICAHPCEVACRRGNLSDAISIRALKRAAVDFGGGLRAGRPAKARPYGSSGKRIAVIGAGPAGLAAACDLALLGHAVVIFEASEHPGGMLTLGIPEYRLPREVIRAEVERITALGVQLKTGVRVGRDVTFPELRRDFDSVFVGIGCGLARGLRIPGVELDGVLNGIDFLLNVNQGYRVEMGRRVIIVGGGNVAFDVARTAMRVITADPFEEKMDTGLQHAFDIARLAARGGATAISLVCLESRAEMPAAVEEIEEGEAEGIRVMPGWGPKRIKGEHGKVTGLEVIRCVSVLNPQGRFSPTFADGSEATLECDTVVMAVGQQADFSFLADSDGVELTPWGTVAIEPETLATTARGVYAGGDVAFGARAAINAIADGKRAARAIHFALTGESFPGGRIVVRPPQPIDQLARKDNEPRVRVPVLPVDRRIGVAEVETGYTEAQARQEADRCLRCFTQTVFDSERCILCGGCLDVCPEKALRFVRIRDLERSDDLDALLRARYGSVETEGTAIVKDEENCVRCGLCAERCPVHAIRMEIVDYRTGEAEEEPTKRNRPIAVTAVTAPQPNVGARAQAAGLSERELNR